MKSAAIYLFKDKSILAGSESKEEVVDVVRKEMAGGENILQFPSCKHKSAMPGAAIHGRLAQQAVNNDLPRLARLLGELDDQRVNRAKRASQGQRRLSVVRS